MNAETSPARRRGRPRSEERAAQRRQELIEAAYAVFSRKGYNATGVADIAAELGIGHGTFYRYFDSKRDILDHVVDYGVDRFMAATLAESPPDAATTLDEYLGQLHTITSSLFALVEREPGLVQIMLIEATSIDDELTERLMGLLDTFAVMTAGYIEHGIDAGFLRADLDTDVTARALMALLGPGLVLALRRGLTDDVRERYERNLLSLFADGLRV